MAALRLVPIDLRSKKVAWINPHQISSIEQKNNDTLVIKMASGAEYETAAAGEGVRPLIEYIAEPYTRRDRSLQIIADD